MYIYILSILVVSFIALCFFKKRFWENRYLVLLLIGGVALVATLTTNFITRNNLGTELKTLSKLDIQSMPVNAALVDSSYFSKKPEMSLTEHLEDGSDNVSHYLLYYYGEDNLRIGYAFDGEPNYKYLKDVYVAPSNSETVAYLAKQRQYYNKRSSKWVSNMSLPFIKTINCLYLPPSEFAAIPDSLIRELPF